MDVSRLDELPPGRQAIDTRVVAQERIGDVVAALSRHFETGQQALAKAKRRPCRRRGAPWRSGRAFRQ
jgi:hypothetical protein